MHNTLRNKRIGKRDGSVGRWASSVLGICSCCILGTICTHTHTNSLKSNDRPFIGGGVHISSTNFSPTYLELQHLYFFTLPRLYYFFDLDGGGGKMVLGKIDAAMSTLCWLLCIAFSIYSLYVLLLQSNISWWMNDWIYTGYKYTHTHIHTKTNTFQPIYIERAFTSPRIAAYSLSNAIFLKDQRMNDVLGIRYCTLTYTIP